jgi:hypothetical protein
MYTNRLLSKLILYKSDDTERKMKHMVLKLSVIGFVSCFLAACAVPQTQMQVNTLTPKKNNAVTALKSCPSCITELKAAPGTRLINLKVETNNPSLDIVYVLQPINAENIRNKFHISKGSFDGVVQIPDGVDVLITGANYDLNTYKQIGDTTVASNKNSATVNLKTVLISEILSGEFDKLTRNQKKSFMQVASLYNVAINSPKMLFSSKLAEAESAANEFYIDMPKDFKKTQLHRSLDSVRFYMKLIDIQSDSYSRSGVVGVDNVKKELSNIDRAIKNSL